MRALRLAEPSDCTSGLILLGLAMIQEATAPRSDPPAPSYAIMGRACFTSTVPLMIGHRVMGHSRLFTGDIAEGRAHYDRSLALYDRAELPLMTRFGSVDSRVSALCFRSQSLWMLGYPKSALADALQAMSYSRAIGHAVTLINTPCLSSLTNVFCGNYATARAELTEGIAFVALNGRNGARVPFYMSYLAKAHAMLGRFDEAQCYIDQAISTMEVTGERVWSAEVHRLAGEIVLASPCPDAGKAKAYFERALAISRAQQAKSWELRSGDEHGAALARSGQVAASSRTARFGVRLV